MLRKRPRTQELQPAEGFGYTQVKVVKYKYTWTINNFSFCRQDITEKLVSPTFSIEPNDNLEWQLHMYPNGCNDKAKDYVGVFLSLVSSCKRKMVKVSFKLYILNTQGKEITKREATVVYVHNQLQSTYGSATFIKRACLLDYTNDILPDDKLTIYCEIVSSGESENYSNDIAMPEPVLSDELELLLENPEFSDVTLSVNGTNFKVHKAILAARSPVFKAMFQSNMVENLSDKVEITDLDEDTVKELLRFIYTGRVSNLQLMADILLQAADKYAVQRLKVMCEVELSKQLSITNATSFFVLADMHDADKLKKQTKNFIHVHILDVANTSDWKAMVQEHPERVAELLTK